MNETEKTVTEAVSGQEVSGQEAAAAEKACPVEEACSEQESCIEQNQTEHVGQTVHYHLSKEQGWAALMYVDRKHNLWKRIFFSAVLLGLGLYFVITSFLTLTAQSTQQRVIGFVCLGFALFYWLIFWIENHRRAKAIGQADREFAMTFYEDGIGVGLLPEEEFLPYDQKNMRVEEQRDCFLISWADEKLFCLEKFRMSEDEIAMARASMQKGLQTKAYHSKKDASLPPRPMSKQREQKAE